MKSFSIIRWSALLLALLCLLPSCGKGAYDLTLEDGVFQNEKKEIAFVEAPSCYRACSALTGETVANITGLWSEDLPLYAIDGISPEDYLTDASYTLYYNQNLTLPTLAEMKPYYVAAAYPGSNSAQEGDALTENEQAQINDLVEILTVGTSYSASKISAYTYENRFELLFFSKEYPGFFYVLEYWKYAEPITFMDGDKEITVKKGVVYNRAENRFYVMGSILEDYFINT